MKTFYGYISRVTSENTFLTLSYNPKLTQAFILMLPNNGIITLRLGSDISSMLESETDDFIVNIRTGVNKFTPSVIYTAAEYMAPVLLDRARAAGIAEFNLRPEVIAYREQRGLYVQSVNDGAPIEPPDAEYIIQLAIEALCGAPCYISETWVRNTYGLDEIPTQVSSVNGNIS